MTFAKWVVADVNGDRYDDIVVIGADTDGPVIDVYLNEGKPRSGSDPVNFIRQRLNLKAHTNTDAVIDQVKFSSGFDLAVVDLDNDGKPDLLASDAGSGEIFVIWNKGANAPAPFEFVPDTFDPTAPSMTFFSPLAQRGSFGPVLGTPIYVTAADLKEGSGRKSIIAYHGALSLNSSSTQKAPFDRNNYESLAIIYPTGARGFDIVKQRDAWPGCDLAFGSTSAACAGWSDGMGPYASLYNFRISDDDGRSGVGFADAPSDILEMDGWTTMGAQQYYKSGTYRPNASPGLQVLAGNGPNGSDAVWLVGAQQVHEFVADNTLKLMRDRTVINTVLGNERSAAATLGALSTGGTPLITAGGMSVVYDPSNAAAVVNEPTPDFLNRPGQAGSWLNWAKLNSGSALLSLSDYCRAPDPCASQSSWYHKPLDGDPPPAAFWGGSHTLVMLDFEQEISTPSGTQFAPFFQKPDEAHFQAFSIMGGSIRHKPFIATGHFASPTESAIVMLDHVDGAVTDPLWNHLSLYRPDTSKTYVSPTPHLDGLTVGRFIEDGLADIGNTIAKGELSSVLVGDHLGTDTTDAIRYVTVHDKLSGAMKGIFPVDASETVKEIGKDGIVVPGLSTLDVGTYTLEVHNATAMASMALSVVNPYGITTTDYDWRAGSTCGLLPSTKDASLWPQQIAVAVSGFTGTVQAVRWINQDDGSAVDLGSDGASYDAISSTVTLIVPQGKLKDGKWRPALRVDGVWQPVGRTWNVTHDTAALAFCASQVDVVNEEAYAQCTNDDYYLDVASYKGWPHLANGSFRFFGTGFAQNNVQSAAVKQGSHRYFSRSLQIKSDNEVDVEFGDLSSDLTPGVQTELYFYSEDGTTVEVNGTPAVGGNQHWRTARSGTCVAAMPQITDYLNTGSGKDGTWQSGDTIKVSGKNILYPVPTATKLVLQGDDGSLYVLEDPRLPDDWYTHHYDNDNMVLYFTVPDDLSTAKITGGTSTSGTTEFGGGLVVAGSSALATTAVSDGTLAVLASNPVGLAVLGSGATGLSIYAGYGNAKWLIKKVEMALAKRSPTEMTKPGQSGDDQTPDPSHTIFFTYEVAQFDRLRTRYIFGAYMDISAYQATSGLAVQQVKNRIALIEAISPLNISVLGEDYWRYSNATITQMVDYGSSPPEQVTVSYSECYPAGWGAEPLVFVHVTDPSSGLLGWKTDIFFDWRWNYGESDFGCTRYSKDISPGSALSVSY